MSEEKIIHSVRLMKELVPAGQDEGKGQGEIETFVTCSHIRITFLLNDLTIAQSRKDLLLVNKSIATTASTTRSKSNFKMCLSYRVK